MRTSSPKKTPTGSSTRITAGSHSFKARDADILRFIAEHTYARFDSLGEFLAPSYAVALAAPPAEQLADTRPPTKRRWPADTRHRLMAVSRLIRKLAARGYLDVIQPWDDQPAWCRITAQGLRRIGLDWPEIPFPETYEDLEGRLRHDRYHVSHVYLVAQMRLALARGESDAPRHRWKGEREIEFMLPPREAGIHRPHKPDGILSLEATGGWDILSADRTTIKDRVEMHTGALVGIEVECSQKSDQRLSAILPDLLEHHDYVWYFCLTNTIRNAVAQARRDALRTYEQQRRVRIRFVEEFVPCQ